MTHSRVGLSTLLVLAILLCFMLQTVSAQTRKPTRRPTKRPTPAVVPTFSTTRAPTFAEAEPCPADQYRVRDSRSSCASLGLPKIGEVCGTAVHPVGGGACLGQAVSWKESAAMCKSYGLRLCRPDELVSLVLPNPLIAQIRPCAAANFPLSKYTVWTADPCTSVRAGRMATQFPTGQSTCEAETSEFLNACCADGVVTPQASCADCPEGTWTAPKITRKFTQGKIGHGLESCSSDNVKANILLILADDLKTALSGAGYNDPLSYTPNMDKLSTQGVTFLNAHSACARCTPSRASFMSGRRPDITTVFKPGDQLRRAVPNMITMPKRLTNSGIFKLAAGVGKIYDTRCTVEQDRFESWTIPWSGWEDAKFWLKPNAPTDQCSRYRKDPFYNGYKSLPTVQCLSSTRGGDDMYYDYHLADRAAEIIKSAPTPWFVAAGFQRPHLPWTAPEKDWYRLPREAFAGEYKATGRRHSLGGARYAIPNNEEISSYGDWRTNPTKMSKAKHMQARQGYYAAVSYVDRMIGRLIDSINATQRQDTIIILTSDHGFHLGDDRRLFGKKTIYEPSTRVPMIFAGPERYVPHNGFFVNEPVELTDLYPTFLDLVDVPPEPTDELLDGVAFNSLFAPEPEVRALKPRMFAVSQFPATGKMGVMSYSFRGRRFRYVCHMFGRAAAKGKCIHEEIYDLQEDPKEWDARPNTKPKQEALQTMRIIFKRHRSSRWLNLMSGRGTGLSLADRAGFKL